MVFVSVLNQKVSVSSSGKIDLPAGEYTPAELKKIAQEVNKAIRLYKAGLALEDE